MNGLRTWGRRVELVSLYTLVCDFSHLLIVNVLELYSTRTRASSTSAVTISVNGHLEVSHTIALTDAIAGEYAMAGHALPSGIASVERALRLL